MKIYEVNNKKQIETLMTYHSTGSTNIYARILSRKLHTDFFLLNGMLMKKWKECITDLFGMQVFYVSVDKQDTASNVW